MVDESRLVMAAAAVILFVALLCLVFPLFFFIFPVIVAALYYLNMNPQAPPDTTKTFFDGFRYGGHRGSPHSFPENSMSGFEQAKDEGADLVEFDLCLTSDGIAVLMHDDTIDRTSDMKGAVGAMTFENLQKANLITSFKRNPNSPAAKVLTKEHIPTLEAAIQWGVKNNIRMLFDVKDHSPQMIAILVKHFSDYNLYDRGIICSFFPWVIYKVKRSDPKIVTGLTWRRNFFAYGDFDKQQPRYTGPLHYAARILDFSYELILNNYLPTFLGADLMLTHEREISEAYVKDMKEKNLRVVAWTVNDIHMARWMMESLKIPILTDFPYQSKQLNALSKFTSDGYQ